MRSIIDVPKGLTRASQALLIHLVSHQVHPTAPFEEYRNQYPAQASEVNIHWYLLPVILSNPKILCRA